MSPVPPMRGSRAANMRSYVDRVEKAAADFTWVFGRIETDGPGEATFHLRFPVLFSQRPLPFLGAGEIEELPEAAMFPTINAVVAGWTLEGQGRYAGADLVVRATGRPGQKIWISWAFAGTAITKGGVE